MKGFFQKKNLLLVYILFFSAPLNAQENRQNKSYVEIAYLYNLTTPKIVKADWNFSFANYNDSLSDIQGETQAGQGLSVTLNIPLHRRFQLSAGAIFQYKRFEIRYFRTDGFIDYVIAKRNFISIPVEINLKMRPEKKIDFNLISGIAYSISINEDYKDFSFRFGGSIFYKRYHDQNFAIGIKTCMDWGLMDQIISRNNIYTWTIERLRLNTLSLGVFIHI